MRSTPDYHFLYIDSMLDAEWLFVAARRYFQRFQPIIVGDLEIIWYIYLPKHRTIAVTTLARRDRAEAVAAELLNRYPQVIHDPLVYDYLEEMKMTLDGRTDFRQRFGVPEGS
jgi:hypothetical protein